MIKSSTAYFDGIDIKVKDIEAMSISMLIKEMKELPKSEKVPYKVEINRNLALPLSTIMLSFTWGIYSIGHHRSGKGANFALSLAIFSYITFLNIGMVMANRGKIPPFIGVWTPNIILFLVTFISIRKI